MLNTIDSRFIVELNKFSIGLPHAEVIDTKGKYLVFRETMAVDESLYSKCGCSVVDERFIKQVADKFSDMYMQEHIKDILYALEHRLKLTEVDEYAKYHESTNEPMDATEWRNKEYNSRHYTIGMMYISDPPESYFENLELELTLGEYRLLLSME